jgi:hypothetical protein
MAGGRAKYVETADRSPFARTKRENTNNPLKDRCDPVIRLPSHTRIAGSRHYRKALKLRSVLDISL